MKRFQEHRAFCYACLPAVMGIILVGGYFSGVPWLQGLIAPEGQREFGLVENLQNALLLATVWLCWRASREESGRARWGWLGVTLFALLVLGEELDWGNHHYRALIGEPRVVSVEGHFNLHNQTDLQTPLKRTVDATMVILFVLLPLLSKRLPSRLARWIPHRWTIATGLIGLVLSRAAHALEDTAVHNNSLRSNISEFREVFVYWMALLYLIELSCGRRPAQDEE